MPTPKSRPKMSPRKKRWLKIIGGALIGGAVVGAAAGKIAAHIESTRVRPRVNAELTAENMTPAALAKRLNAKFGGQIEQRRLLELSKEWLDAFDGKPDNANDRLHKGTTPQFPILRADTLVKVIETAADFQSMYRPAPISPRELMGGFLKARELMGLAKGAGEDPKHFYDSRAAAMVARRDPVARHTIEFFRRLKKYPGAIEEIYHVLK